MKPPPAIWRSPVLTLLALAAVVSCGTEPASGPVLPTRVVESGLCPNYYPGDTADTVYMAAREDDRDREDFDSDLVPIPCSSADVRRDTTFDDCCRGWHYSGCTCAAGEDGTLVWSCEQIAWDGVCEPPGELDPLPRASDFARTYSLLEHTSQPLAGACGNPTDAILAGSCAPERYDVPQPISGCYDGAWYDGCVCDRVGCLGHLTWTCTSRRDEPRCTPAPEVE